MFLSFLFSDLGSVFSQEVEQLSNRGSVAYSEFNHWVTENLTGRGKFWKEAATAEKYLPVFS